MIEIGKSLSHEHESASELLDLEPLQRPTLTTHPRTQRTRAHLGLLGACHLAAFGRGSGLLSKILGNWDVSGIYQYQSGGPFSIRTNDDFAGVGPGSGAQFWNQIGDPHISPGAGYGKVEYVV